MPSPSRPRPCSRSPKENVEALKELVADWKEDLIDQFRHIETGVELIAEDVETPKMEVPVEIQDNLINAIYGCHDGVLRMIPAYPEVVETSSNLAIINIGEGKASFKILGRSSREDMKDYLVKTLESCFNMAGMKVETAGSYGGWDPNPDSEILHHMLKVFREQNGEEATVEIDHAGLECSIILGKYPHLQGSVVRSHHPLSSHHHRARPLGHGRTLLGHAEESPRGDSREIRAN